MIQKNQYASNLLYITSLALARVSVLIFVMRLSPQRLYRLISISLIVAIALWSSFSVLALAFQCSVPKPWDYTGNRCLDRVSLVNCERRPQLTHEQAALWTSIETINAALDLAIVLLPTVILATIQPPLWKRLVAISMFACRILVIAIIIPEIIFIRQALQSTDVLYSWWKVVLLTQLIVATSITCSSMQYLKPFLDSIESGLIRADGGRRQGGTSRYGSKVSPKYGSHFSQEAAGKRDSQQITIPMKKPSMHRPLPGQGRVRRLSDAESDGSESKIIQTRTFEVVSEPIDSIEQESIHHAL